MSLLQHYWLYALREQSIFEGLNKLEATEHYIAGYFWASPLDKEKLTEDFVLMSQNDPNFMGVEIKKVQTKHTPPTRFLENEVLYPSQQIVNTYGVPRYKEINPAVFTVASFPFLFGVMFGDMGHGLMLLAFSLFVLLVQFPSYVNNPISQVVKAAKPFRYLLVSMGFFAVYAGLIYNEFFGLSLPLFATCYKKHPHKFSKKDGCVYPVGIDTTWAKSANEIGYLNSYKMKLSIIIGVCQMTLGIFLKGLNAMFQKDWSMLWLEFLPQLIFFEATFGYMVLLIIIKWLTNWEAPGMRQPPSIVNVMIDFVSKVVFIK